MQKATNVIISLLIGSTAWAAEIPEYNNNVRALGMGNAFAPFVNDKDSLFLNPAGLGKVKGINITVMDPQIGVNGLDNSTTLQSGSSSSTSGNTFADTLRKLYGKNLWLGAGAKTAFTIPGFAFSAYDNV